MAEECDVCVAIWDGTSNGTRITSHYAQSLGKPVTTWCKGVITRLAVK